MATPDGSPYDSSPSPGCPRPLHSANMPAPLRLAFHGIDHPHGAHWRQQLANFQDQAEIVAFVPSFGGGTSSLEERYADLPRYDSVAALLKQQKFDAAVVCLPNREGPGAIVELAQAGK